MSMIYCIKGGCKGHTIMFYHVKPPLEIHLGGKPHSLCTEKPKMSTSVGKTYICTPGCYKALALENPSFNVKQITSNNKDSDMTYLIQDCTLHRCVIQVHLFVRRHFHYHDLFFIHPVHICIT